MSEEIKREEPQAGLNFPYTAPIEQKPNLNAPVSKPDPVKSEGMFNPKADKPHEIKPEDRDRRVKEIREALQMFQQRMIANRPPSPSEPDPNQTLFNNIFAHLDALDGNPEAKEAARLEAERNEERAEKRRVHAEKEKAA